MAQIGWGSVYEVFDPLAGRFVAVSEVFAIVPPARTSERVDVTTLCDAPGTRHFRARRADPGEIEIQFNRSPGDADDARLRRLEAARTVLTHRITFPPGEGGMRARVTITGVITGYARNIPLDDRMTASVTIAASGAEAWDEISTGAAGLVFVAGVFQQGVFQ